MKVRITGKGWVTPLGVGIDEVWARMLASEQATPRSFDDSKPQLGFACRVPADALTNLPAHPRLRRASAISRFAAAAGLAALTDAGVQMNEEIAARTALIFTVSNGGVIYTRRFFDDVATSGARAASPLLFPETVFNAPASHLAAVLGISGITYTLVGDGAVGMLGIQMAVDLLQNGSVDRCLVVGAEEADPLVFQAYRRWRFCRKAAPIGVYERPPRGMILSEGAGALLLEPGGGMTIDALDAGENFYRRAELPAVLSRIVSRLINPNTGAFVTSANGTFIDGAEVEAIANTAAMYSPKLALGESVGASVLWQVIAAAQILRTRRLPSVHLALKPDANLVVLSSGLNQQAAGLRLSVIPSEAEEPPR